jgi:hypothetical protein
MPTASRKQATKRASAHPSNQPKREARRLQRATRQGGAATNKSKRADALIDRDFHASAEEIDLDPQLDENEGAEP